MSTFTVNGRLVTAEKNKKLIVDLRDTLRLTSVKNGCSEGACGTCMVLIDGKATKACVQQTDKLEGKSIVTVEGLTPRERDVYRTRSRMRRGTVRLLHAGMVISAKGLLDVNGSPTARTIRNAQKQHLPLHRL